MKTCPTCQASFPDGFRYCPSDSDTLIKTEEYAQSAKTAAPVIAENGAPVIRDGKAETTQATPPPLASEDSRAPQPATVSPQGNGSRATINQSAINQQASQPTASFEPQLTTQNTTARAAANDDEPTVVKPSARTAAPTAAAAAGLGANDGLKLMLPESAGLFGNLVAQVQQFVRDFGKPRPKLAAGAAGSEFLLPEESFIPRLQREFQANWQDFRRDPRAFALSVWRGEGAGHRRKRLLQAGVAMGIIAYAFIFTTFLILGLFRFPTAEEVVKKEEVQMVDLNMPVDNTPREVPKEVPKGKGGFTGGSKPKVEQAGGGGGGGRNQPKPPSQGNPPQMSMVPQIMPPNPEPPKIKNPQLVVPTTTLGDPMLSKNFPGPDGLKDAPPAPPSSGPGSGAGIGTGKGTGAGSGDGAGQGPGQGFNKGGGNPNMGGGPGTDGSGGVFPAGPGMRPVITYKEKAKYTEEARQNKVQGTVSLSVIFTADGRISGIRVVRGLPDGLTEKAIEAAQRIKFQPAMKNGQPVSVRMTLEFNFAVY
jgi:TonB family protein